MAIEERKRRSRLQRFLPWLHDELDVEAGPPPEEGHENGSAGGDEQAGPPEDNNKRRRGSQLFGKGLAVIITLLVFLVSGYGWGTKQTWDNRIKQVAALDPNSSAIDNKLMQAGDENFLLVGADTVAPAQAAGNDATAGVAGTDALMIAHVPASHGRVVVVSFPHDLEVDEPECQAWDANRGTYTNSTVQPDHQSTITKAYASGGPKCVTKVVQQISGLAINHFIGIDFQGLKGMVDAMHGVEVCSDTPLRDAVLGNVLPNAGKQTISGSAAVSYVRATHVVGDPRPDLGAINRQRRFLTALLAKASSTQVLMDPNSLNGYFGAFAKWTVGENIGVDSLLTLTQSLQGVDSAHVTLASVPTTGTPNERGRQTPLADDAKAMFDAVIRGKPLPTTGAQKPGDKPPAQLNGPTDVKVQVLNGSDRNGAAQVAADALHKQGFDVVRRGAADQPAAHTVIRYSNMKAAAAQTLASAVPGSTLQEDASMGGAIQLLLGPDFSGKVVPPTMSKPGQPAANPVAPSPSPTPGNVQTDLPASSCR
jgi:LCP family protein required for cell wall assembly